MTPICTSVLHCLYVSLLHFECIDISAYTNVYCTLAFFVDMHSTGDPLYIFSKYVPDFSLFDVVSLDPHYTMVLTFY